MFGHYQYQPDVHVVGLEGALGLLQGAGVEGPGGQLVDVPRQSRLGGSVRLSGVGGSDALNILRLSDVPSPDHLLSLLSARQLLNTVSHRESLTVLNLQLEDEEDEGQ